MLRKYWVWLALGAALALYLARRGKDGPDKTNALLDAQARLAAPWLFGP